MTDQNQFAVLCERVCEAHGWELLRSGIQVSFANGRHQLVELEIVQFEAEELVRLSTTIGSIEHLSPVRLTVALRLNAELAHGCLAIKNEDLVMTDTLMLDEADFGEIEASVAFLARTADDYEKTLFGTDED